MNDETNEGKGGGMTTWTHHVCEGGVCVCVCVKEVALANQCVHGWSRYGSWQEIETCVVFNQVRVVGLGSSRSGRMKFAATAVLVGSALAALNGAAMAQQKIQDIPARDGAEKPGWIQPPAFSIDPSKQNVFGNKLKGVGTNQGTTVLPSKDSSVMTAHVNNPKQFMADKTQASTRANGPAPLGVQAIGFAKASENTSVDPYATSQQPGQWGGVAPSTTNPMYSVSALSTDPGMSIGGQAAADTDVPEFLELHGRVLSNGTHVLTLPEGAPWKVVSDNYGLMDGREHRRAREATENKTMEANLQHLVRMDQRAMHHGVAGSPLRSNNDQSQSLLEKKEIPEFMAPPESSTLMGNEVAATTSTVEGPPVSASAPAYPVHGGAPVYPASYSYVHHPAHLVANPAPKETTLLLESTANDGCTTPVTFYKDCTFTTRASSSMIKGSMTLEKIKGSPKGVIVPSGCRATFFSKETSSFSSKHPQHGLIVKGKGQGLCFHSIPIIPLAIEISHDIDHAKMAKEIAEMKTSLRKLQVMHAASGKLRGGRP